jgi:hypothetical protein
MLACGGGDDDDSDDSSSDDSGADSESGDDSDNDDRDDEGEDSDANIPDIEAAFYGSGEVRIKITGDKDLEIRAEGNGIAQEGFALFTYQSSDASVQIGLSNVEGEPPGAIAVTTSEISTAAEWGRDCTVSLDQSDGEASGEFSCDEVDALVPGSTDTIRVKLEGTFTAGQ